VPGGWVSLGLLPYWTGRDTNYNSSWSDVVHHCRACADHGAIADPDSWRDGRANPDVGTPSDRHAAGEPRARSDVSVIPYNAVMLNDCSSVHNRVTADRRIRVDHSHGQDHCALAHPRVSSQEGCGVNNGHEPKTRRDDARDCSLAIFGIPDRDDDTTGAEAGLRQQRGATHDLNTEDALSLPAWVVIEQADDPQTGDA
jgi:hypothetical protein